MGLAGNDLANGFEIIIMFPPAAATGKEEGEEGQGGKRGRQQAECKLYEPFKFSCKTRIKHTRSLEPADVPNSKGKLRPAGLCCHLQVSP